MNKYSNIGGFKALFTGALAFVLLAFTSCSTFNVGGGSNLPDIKTIFEVGTKVAVSEVVSSKPELNNAFALAASVVKDFAESDTVFSSDVIRDQIVNALEEAGISADSFYVEGALSVALSAYEKFIRANSTELLKDHEPLRQVLLSIAKGVEAGLAVDPVSATVSSPPVKSLEDVTVEDLKL